MESRQDRGGGCCSRMLDEGRRMSAGPRLCHRKRSRTRTGSGDPRRPAGCHAEIPASTSPDPKPVLNGFNGGKDVSHDSYPLKC